MMNLASLSTISHDKKPGFYFLFFGQPSLKAFPLKGTRFQLGDRRSQTPSKLSFIFT